MRSIPKANPLTTRGSVRHPRFATAGWVLPVLACGALIGCRAAGDLGTVRLSERGSAGSGQPVVVGVGSFRADEPRRSTATSDNAALPVRTAEQADEGVAGVEAVIGAPELPAVVAHSPSGGPQDDAPREVIVDRVVGQINGEPIFAAAFFEPMDARLRAEAARVTDEREAREFIRDMASDISLQLREQMENRLLLDEFRASLTVEERVGIAALIERIQTDLQRGAMGSRELADRRLRESSGRTIEEESQYLGDRAFIQEHLRRTITNRIAVSARDVEQEYQRRWDEFNPPPIARLRVIRVPNASAVAVTDALLSGRSFQEIAAEYSRWRPDEGNLIETTLGEAGIAEAEFFGVATLNDPAQQLAVGQVAGPIELGSSTWWLHLDEIERPPGVPLYEAQIQIDRELREQRFMEERQRHFEQLLERSNFSDRAEMIAKLTTFGAQRYLGITIPDAPRVGEPGNGR